MQIKQFSLHRYQHFLINGLPRLSVFLYIADDRGRSGWGEISPLPKWSKETIEDSLEQIKKKQQRIKEIEWDEGSWLKEIAALELLPAVSFGLESALLSILDPIKEHRVQTSALLMGSPKEILVQAELRHQEGYTSAKLKVCSLSFHEASEVISSLKDRFRLRIDVNRAWTKKESLHFFSLFSPDDFDYIEEPFQNPHDLAQFSHPLAVDESFPEDLSLDQLELLPTLKALIYKPTIQGGMARCLPLHEWTKKRGISLVLSSSFESDFGLAQVASMAQRLALVEPVGLGTYHYLQDLVCANRIHLSSSLLIPAFFRLKTHCMEVL